MNLTLLYNFVVGLFSGNPFSGDAWVESTSLMDQLKRLSNGEKGGEISDDFLPLTTCQDASVKTVFIGVLENKMRRLKINTPLYNMFDFAKSMTLANFLVRW